MAQGVMKAWSTTASSNGNADSNINFAEGQSPPSLNNSARALMATVKGLANQILGAKTTGGSANAQTFTSDSVAAISTAYGAGMGFVFVAGYTNSGACTLNVDGVGAVAIRKGGANTALAANDIVAGGVYFVVYNGTYWTLLNPESGQVAAQPADADLTAIAATSYSSGNMLLQKTAADTWSVTLTPSVTDLTLSGQAKLAAGSAGAPSLYMGGDTTTGWYRGSANNISAAVSGALAFQIYSGATDIAAGQLLVPNGSAGAPTLTSRSDLNTGWYFDGSDGMGLSLGGTLRLSLTTTIFDSTIPIRSRIPVSSETSGTLTTASANKKVKMTADCTINDGVFTADDFIYFENDAASTKQIIQDTGMTLRLHGTTTTGTRTIAVRGRGMVDFATNSDATVCGDVT